MKTFAFCLLSVLILSGCSTKTQTNPIPKNNKTIVPNSYEATMKKYIDEDTKKDFDTYANMILTNKNATGDTIDDYKENTKTNKNYAEVTAPKPVKRKNIWQTGLDISKKEDKVKR